jgi:hypothetical protein
LTGRAWLNGPGGVGAGPGGDDNAVVVGRFDGNDVAAEDHQVTGVQVPGGGVGEDGARPEAGEQGLQGTGGEGGTQRVGVCAQVGEGGRLAGPGRSGQDGQEVGRGGGQRPGDLTGEVVVEVEAFGVAAMAQE